MLFGIGLDNVVLDFAPLRVALRSHPFHFVSSYLAGIQLLIQCLKILLENTTVAGDAIVIDFRGMEHIPIGNRFLEYVLYPEQNISVRAVDGKNKKGVTISIGHSIINRTSEVDVGHLTLGYGGGGHKRAGACQVSYKDADKIIQEILQVINNGQPKSANLSSAGFLKHP